MLRRYFNERVDFMAEFTASNIQLVPAGQNVLFAETPVCGNNCITHRAGSGLVTVKGATSQCRARYKAFFSGNISIPTGGTVSAIALAIAIDGEPVSASSMIQTPTAVNALNNVATEIYIDAPRGCCQTISVKNISTQAISVQNANLIVERVC